MALQSKSDHDGHVTEYWEGIADIMLSDPLSNANRIKRRNLIATSALGIVVAVTEFIPKKLLGVELTGASQNVLIWALITVIIYQWITFKVYSWPEKMNYYGKLYKKGYKLKKYSDAPVASIPAYIRNYFDFSFPYLVALISVSLLLWFILPTSSAPKTSEWLDIATKVSLFTACLGFTIKSFFDTRAVIKSIGNGSYVPVNPIDKLDD